MSSKIKIPIILLGMLINLNCNQNLFFDTHDFFIQINQNKEGSLRNQRYTINGYYLTIEEDLFVTENSSKSQIVYHKKLTNYQLELIIDAFKKNDLFALDDRYEVSIIGGYVNWTLQFISDQKYKKIFIASKRVDAVDAFFAALNQLIPQKEYKIARYYYD